MELGLENQESQEAASLGDKDTRNLESNFLPSHSSSFVENLEIVLPFAPNIQSFPFHCNFDNVIYLFIVLLFYIDILYALDF